MNILANFTRTRSLQYALMKPTILFFVLFLSIFHVSGQSAYKQNLEGTFSITFPGKPTQTDTMGCNTYACKDSDAIYLAIIKKPITLLQPLLSSKRHDQYEGAVKGALSVANGKLISKKTFEINGLKGLDIEYIATANPKLPDLRFDRFLFTNKGTFTFHFWTLSENKLATKKQRELFFNSLLVTGDKETLQNDKDSIAFMFGTVIGYILAAVAFIGGIIFLVYKVSKKKTIGI